MASVPISPPDALVTVSDLIQRYPHIPIARVRFVPAPGAATEADVVHIRDHEKRLFELVDGILVEKAMGTKESMIAMTIGSEIRQHMKTHPLGVVLGADGMLKLKRRLVRMPDVSFISWDRLPDKVIPKDAVWKVPPDLAVEVLSEGNTKDEIKRKLREYFKAGTTLAWVVDPESESVRVYISPTKPTKCVRGDTLDGGKVIPGFTMTVDAVFAV
jgi:Uma2 family endonuclease